MFAGGGDQGLLSALGLIHDAKAPENFAKHLSPVGKKCFV
jgi:hypothetical protein